ncbi:hypothetical protein [Okeania sp. SIO3B5]|nr:hypothetical protein [Okeania sp. SIO3B5]
MENIRSYISRIKKRSLNYRNFIGIVKFSGMENLIIIFFAEVT